MGGMTSIFYSGAVEATAGTVVSGAVSSFTRTYEMEEGLDVTLYSLRQEVSKIQCAISAARGRKISDQNLLKWLAQLINAAYLGNYYNRRFKNHSSFPPTVDDEGMSNFHYPTGHTAKRQRTIKTLLFGNDELKEVHDVLKMLKSIDMCAFMLMVNAQPERPMKRYLYMDHHLLLNRDKEKEQVMQFLFEPSTTGGNNVDVLPIVGPSGVGKTSLSLHCFCEPKVQNHFSLKIYISSTYMAFPDNHGIPKTFEQILERCNCPDASSFDENTVKAILKQKFSSERLLLVIDNVWRLDFAVWNVLLDCLRCAKKGSKLIVVTDFAICNEYAASANFGPVKPIMLDGFSEDEYMLFFKEHAFGGADPEDFPELSKTSI